MTRYIYNTSNQKQSIRDARLKTETRVYGASGQLQQVIDRTGQLSTLTYDAMGRVKIVSFGASAANPTAYKSQIESTWDAANRVTRIVKRTCADPISHLNCSSVAASSTITRSFDDLDRLVSEVTAHGEVSYTYDAAGRRTSMTIKNGPPGTQITQPTIAYTYDDANRLTGISQAAGDINGGEAQHITLAYDAAGQRTQTTLANGVTVAYTRDDAGQITAIVYRKAGGAIIGDLLYEYDAGGRRISAGGSLAQVNLPETDIADAAYDANNRLLAWNGKSFAYDDAGNLTSDGMLAYQWDERNQLTSISDGTSEIVSFQYDGRGRRTVKTAGSETTGFLYDGPQIVQELAGADSTATVKAHLLTGSSDENFLRIVGNDGSNLQSVLSDVNNNSVMLLNAAQDRVVGFGYEPYGMTRSDAVNDNPYMFTGRENDNPGNEQGLYYYRARYYMPGTGRFISEDPIGWASGQVNNYAYVGGNPLDFRDPTGLDDSFENSSAAFGDAITFGITKWIRGKLGIDGVNTCSAWYEGVHLTTEIAFTIATLGVGAEVEAAESLAAKLSDATYLHYTDAVGHEGIMLQNAIRANAKNQVFLTQDMVSSSEALNVLFAGSTKFVGKGTHVIAIDGTGLNLIPGVQANEIIHVGTIRLEGRILYSGPNPF